MNYVAAAITFIVVSYKILIHYDGHEDEMNLIRSYAYALRSIPYIM